MNTQETKTQEIKKFDVRQTGIPKKKKDSIEKIYADFSVSLETVLVNYVSLPAKVSFQGLNFSSYENYLKSINRGVLYSIFDVEPMELSGLVCLDNDLVLVSIDRILGGEGQLPSTKRELSIIEMKMSEALVSKILNRLNAVWETFGECSFKFKASSQLIGKMKFVSPEESVISASFSVTLGTITGILDICFPMSFVKPFLASLDKSESHALGDLSDPKVIPIIRHKMEGIPVFVRAYLGELQIALKELTDLEVGDVIRLGSVEKNLLVKANQVPVFLGKPGVFNNKLAIEVVQQIQS